jgi:hypothetical protein
MKAFFARDGIADEAARFRSFWRKPRTSAVALFRDDLDAKSRRFWRRQDPRLCRKTGGA